MKKGLIFFIFIFLLISKIYAANPADGLRKIPDNFKSECYEYYNKIDKSSVWKNSTNEKYQTYKVKINKTKDLVITQLGFIIPYKFYSELGNIYKYSNNLGINNKYWLDYNPNTYHELKSDTQNEIILSFDEVLEKNNFSFVFRYKTNNYYPEYYISSDKNKWSLIQKQDIEDFSFKYLKIKFISKTKKQFLENIKISELNFVKKSQTILVKSHFNDDIEIYAKYNCTEAQLNTKALDYNIFSIDKNTKTIKLNTQKNPKYNVYTKKDIDNDWIEDSIDNCKTIYNPNQKDSNGDGRGDLCSDDDKDGIIGFYDNCPYISNSNQKDLNQNNIGDVCEFDADKDGVFDSIDNCRNMANPKQEDSDNDNIGNICDNCKYYNPAQLDKNNDGIGDICTQKEEYLKNNDDDKDGILNNADNCPKLANPNQKDDDKDGIGNICDNCQNIQNRDQTDKNDNDIGDICEDVDNDGLEGLIDNCPYIANAQQEDDDNNGIGNLCEDRDNDNILADKDNCPYTYNPKQEDKDNDNIGDKCDSEDSRFIESNKPLFIGLLILLTILFGTGIFIMVRKMK